MRSTIAIVYLALLMTSNGACFLPEVDPPDLPGSGDGGVIANCDGTFTGDVAIPYADGSPQHSFECTIDGNVTINAIVDLSEAGTLATVKHVTGSILISGTAVNPGTIFENLEQVGVEIRIQNSAIVNFAGFDKLTSVGDIYFDDNNVLTTITGFSALEQVGTLQIRTSPALETIDAFASLATATKAEILTANALTTITGFGASFASINTMSINTAHALVNLPAMPNLVNGEWIEFNQVGATSMDALTNLASVVNLSITHSDSLTTMSFPALTTVSNRLTLSYNDALDNLAGFDSLTSAGEWHICNNSASLTQEMIDAWVAIHCPSGTPQCS